jgi:hypothetical protein
MALASDNSSQELKSTNSAISYTSTARKQRNSQDSTQSQLSHIKPLSRMDSPINFDTKVFLPAVLFSSFE